jgi:pilus assembly protein CpaC
VTVGVDVDKLQGKLQELLPSAAGVKIDALGDTLVISGRVTDGVKVARIVTLAEAFLGGAKVVNLMQVEGGQQVMLEVKVAEVSRTLMDELGVEFDLTRTISNTTVGVLSKLLSSGASTISVERPNGRTNVTLSAEMKKSLVKILAEPTITAMNGQEGSFLAGGKIFIPVPQGGSGGSTTITLEEKEFGVGLRFLPTVLEDGLINLRVTPEVSELSQVGSTVSGAGGQISLLPSITTRRASTTVQLHDGESFAIGGLIKSNITESIRAMPVLGELPILGALFRSSAFQNEQSELLFIVTPRLAKALPASPQLPTDAYKQPTRAEFFLEGKLEQGPKPPPSKPPGNPATSQSAEPEATTTASDDQP